MKKRIYSVMLSLTFIASALATNAFAAKVKIDSIDEKAAVLEKIGLIDSNINEETLTNLQIANYLLKIFNIDSPEGEIFDYAQSCNILDSYDKPNDELTYNMLCKMTVSALGYDVEAEMMGGYPSGYLSVAGSKKLLKNVTVNEDGSADREDVINMLYNMLEIEMCNRVFNNGLSIKEGTPLDSMGITKAEGIVTAVKDRTMMGDSVNFRDEIAVDSVLYTCKLQEDPAAFFAKKVVYYYDSEENEILYLFADKDGVLTVDASMLTEYKYDDGTFDVKYSDLREEEYKFKAKPKYVSLNGEEITSGEALEKLLDFDYGIITAIDYNNDKVYDVLLAEKYENYFVKFRGTDFIYDMYSDNEIMFNFDDDDYTYTFIKNGETASFSDISNKCVLSVYKYCGGKDIKIYITEKSVNGRLEQKSTEDKGKTKLVIDGFPYYTFIDMQNVSLGDITTYYLDINGNVAGYDSTNIVRNMEYGYLVKLYEDEDSANIAAKIFTRAEGMLNLQSDSPSIKITYKGESAKCSLNVIKSNYSSVFDGDGKFIPQLVQFVSDGSNLKKLVFAAEETEDNENKSYFKITESGKRVYGTNKMGNCAVEGGAEGYTWIVAIPPDDEMNDNSKYQSDYALSNTSSYNCTLYDTDDFMKARVCVIKLADSNRVTNTNQVDKGLPFAVVEEMELMEEYNEEKEEVEKFWRVSLGYKGKVADYKLRYQTNGLYMGEMSISTGDVQSDARLINTNDDSGSFLNPGDVGQIALDQFGYLVAFRKIYNAKYDWMTFKVAGDYVQGYNIAPGFRSGSAAESVFGYGEVKNISEDYIVIECKNDNIPDSSTNKIYTAKSVYPLKNNNLVGYIYDSKEKRQKVEAAEVSDIHIGDKIVFNYVLYKFESFVVLR
ncbi:MAG: hypothetical protein SOZ34_10245 [Clostridia bacterium]|nr:hypothetical protein [Clostridia bacterium]